MIGKEIGLRYSLLFEKRGKMKLTRQLLLVCGLTIFGVLISSCSGSDTSQTPGYTPPPTHSNTPTPSPTPLDTSVEIIGEEEMVYDWTTDRCSDNMLPDLPVRPFKDASGLIQLNLSFTSNYRMTGPDFDSLQVDCSPTLISNFDRDPSHFSQNEWIGSTYTLDGNTVYALVHNEFYGSDASRWIAGLDFSADQGLNDWSYQQWDGVSYSDMNFDAANNRWQGYRSLCQIGNTWVHPDSGCEPTRTWTSPVNDTVTISGSTGLYNPIGSNGVIVTILKNDLELWSVTIESEDGEEYFFSLEEPVQVGDIIRFTVNARGNTNYDSTYLNPEINLGGDPCVSGSREQCAQYAITFAVSTDGGQTFAQPLSPDHLVATLPYQYSPDWGFIGTWQPSNIVFNPRDGYYYFLVQHEYGTANKADRRQGSCVLRTTSLDDPTSWRAWDGTGFNMRMIDPYTEPDADPAAHTCKIVSHENLGYAALNFNLTYNSFFEKFLLVGVSVNAAVHGFYYSLSDDLVNWSPMELLLEADLAQNTNWEVPYLAYPALVDHDDSSRNFEVTGQRPYLYFTRINALSPALDFDLLRMQVQFDLRD